MKFIKLSLYFFCIVSTSVFCQSNLPPCNGPDTSIWTNCIGKQTFANGDNYYGEFKNGKNDGYGIFIYGGGDKYVGGFKENVFHGYGKLIRNSGYVFSGIWSEGVQGSLSEYPLARANTDNQIKALEERKRYEENKSNLLNVSIQNNKNSDIDSKKIEDQKQKPTVQT